MRSLRSIPIAIVSLALGTAASAQQPPGGVAAKESIPAVLQLAPPQPRAAYVPFPALGPVELDEGNNGVGVAQAVARERQAQGRVLWIDAVANLERLSSPEKIQALVKRIASAGFNTIVLDVKPIVGQTLYPSKHAERLTQWNKATLPANLDPVAEVVKAAKTAGVGVVGSMNAFSEGHRGMSKGPAYARVDWQTVVCEPQLCAVDPKSGTRLLINPIPNVRAEALDELTAYTSTEAVAPTSEAAVALLDASRKVISVMSGAAFSLALPPVPRGGALLVGEGQAADSLRRLASTGQVLSLQTTTRFVPVVQSRIPGVPVWVNPHHPEVQQRLLEMVTEVLTRYPLDGIVFDDRLRYAAINADFSEATRRGFEEWLGRAITWPDDVLRCDVSFPGMVVRWLPGPCMDAWLAWRALHLRNWVARAAAAARAARPSATVGAYVGSWYGDYPPLGANWAADDFQAGFRFLTDTFRQTGFAGLLDWISPGCYYGMPTIADASRLGYALGATVEAAGQLANRAANSQTWVYAGISLEKYDRNPDGLARALQAAAASTQGVMVFDLSHKIDQFWPVFQKAFAKPARAPHAVPGLLAEARRRQSERKAAGIADPPVIIQNGLPGTGL